MNKRIKKSLISTILAITIFTLHPVNTFAATSFDTSDTITLNEEYMGTLATEKDINYYNFTTTGNDSFYKIELRNTEATDSIGLHLYSGNDVTTEVYNFVANKASVNQDTRKLEANHTYYIAVKNPYTYTGSPIGNYKLSVTEIKDDVPDFFNNSLTIPLNKKVTYNLDADKDSDYYKFKTSSNDSFYKIELANSEATDTIGLYLYSEDDVTTEVFEITASKANLSSKISKLEPNHTYYMVVKNPYEYYGNPKGAYKLNIKEIKDDAPDSFDNSIKLSLNKKSTYKLNVDGDIDYFKFKTSKKGTYTITLANKSCSNYVGATIYEENDVTQKIGTVSVNKASKDTQTFKLKANHTYYIAVAKNYDFYNVNGEYSLTIIMKK